MYKNKFKEWRLEKNLTPRQARFITRKAIPQLDEEGKKTTFRHRGKPVPPQKVARHVERNLFEAHSISDVKGAIAWLTTLLPTMSDNYYSYTFGHII